MSKPPLPSLLPIPPFTRAADGTITLPGSKSLTNRALLLAALCAQPVELRGALFSEDTEIMSAALRSLGVHVEADAARCSFRVAGAGGILPATTATIQVGNAGTAARFLTALCAAAGRGVYRFDGVEAMRRRPMGGLLEALTRLGAEFRFLGQPGCFPFELHARGLRGGTVEIDARESSQMLSALLMVAPLAAAPLCIRLVGDVRWPFVAMTLRQLAQFGQPTAELAARPAAEFALSWGRPFTAPSLYPIEPDATAASYFLALPIAAGGSVRVAGLPEAGESLQGDLAFAGALERVGLQLSREAGALVSTRVAGAPLRGIDADFNLYSDTFLTLAALAPLLEGPTTLRGLTHTRKQETDRVAGMAAELRRLGQDVVETEDTLTITPRPLLASQIETYHDHRFAMSFGVLGCHDLRANGQPWITVGNPACCAKTFPDFFEVLAQLRAHSHPMSTAPDFITVAIDGGAASGKSSTSRALSERFHLLHVDTGAHYRFVTHQLLERGVDAADESAVAAALAALPLGTRLAGRSSLIEIDGRIPGEEIRGQRVNEQVSRFAAVPAVRQFLLAYQRSQAQVARVAGFRGLIMEGRDIGSVIFPEADFRFYLQADPVERARRRAAEGQTDAIHERDRLDASRKTAPLTLPNGATAIDSTHLSLLQVVDQLGALIAPRLGATTIPHLP
jgi:3-phosphoshikimate 1-carboxyvinyltransferase